MEFKFREGTLHVHADASCMGTCGRNQAEGKCLIMNEGAQFIDGQANPDICAACLNRVPQVEVEG